MNILFVAAEASPLVKIGGLGDVIGSLPKALGNFGHDVRVMLPKYGIIDVSKYSLLPAVDSFNIKIRQTEEPITLLTTNLNDELTFYLIDNKDYFGSTDVYGKDEQRRFFFFDKAVVAVLAKLSWQPDIIHCHDWHTALIPMWLRKTNWNGNSLFTIHNLAYQGNFNNDFLFDYGLSRDWQYLPDGISKLPLNFMSQGIIWSDKVSTVSENYAREVVTAEYGAGLDHLLRFRQDEFLGIINGIDYEVYNPVTDHFIAANYDSSRLSDRWINKMALQKRVGLIENKNIPLIGMVSRLDEQKGFDIVIESLPLLFESTQSQIVILGKGKEHYEDLLKKAVKKYTPRLVVCHDFDDTLAHLIYAGCDMFLMASRFEPCGLGQLIAMRYGAIPIVRHTGGLVDTVKDMSPDLNKGSGFVFDAFSVEAMLGAIQRAIIAYEHNNVWQEIMKRIMSLDFSWQNSARKYESVYQNLLESRKHVER